MASGVPVEAGFNEDGHADLIFARASKRSEASVGDGAGGFACSRIPGTEERSYEAAVGDVNGDGDLDAVFSARGDSRVCVGDGAGGFTCTRIPGSGDSEGVAIASPAG
jgi:hypothetical protein